MTGKQDRFVLDKNFTFLPRLTLIVLPDQCFPLQQTRWIITYFHATESCVAVACLFVFSFFPKKGFLTSCWEDYHFESRKFQYAFLLNKLYFVISFLAPNNLQTSLTAVTSSFRFLFIPLSFPYYFSRIWQEGIQICLLLFQFINQTEKVK